jgi:hypothetical protein
MNFTSFCSGEPNESYANISISMLKSPKKTFVGHGVGATMMNSCNISKKIVSEVK